MLGGVEAGGGVIVITDIHDNRRCPSAGRSDEIRSSDLRSCDLLARVWHLSLYLDNISTLGRYLASGTQLSARLFKLFKNSYRCESDMVLFYTSNGNLRYTPGQPFDKMLNQKLLLQLCLLQRPSTCEHKYCLSFGPVDIVGYLLTEQCFGQ
jgi:hypothetical protein